MTEVPKPPGFGTRTKTTRPKGNGAGWAGPAKGAGASTAARAPVFEAGNQAASGNGPAQAAARATRETMLMVYERIAADPLAPHAAQVMAADKWLDRHEGKPGQSVKLQGDAEHPVEIVYSWADALPSE